MKTIIIRQRGKVIVKIKRVKVGVDVEGYINNLKITTILNDNSRIVIRGDDY